MTKSNQDPLDDPILDEILTRYGRNYRMGFDVVAKKEAKTDLLQWRSDYVMGLLPKKEPIRNFEGQDSKRFKDGWNALIDDIRAKNERGR